MADPAPSPAPRLASTPGWERRGYAAVRRGRDLLVAPVAGLLSLLRIPPWAVSLSGVAAAASVVWTVRLDRPAWALAGFAGALLADAVDGAVARRRGVGSGAGKLLDQLCDSATFACLAAAAAGAGLAGGATAALAVYLATALVAVELVLGALAAPGQFASHPRAGFLAHLPKLPFYVAFPAALLGVSGAGWVEGSLLLVAGAAGGRLLWRLAAERRRRG